jgi:nucleoside-diphosphate kinase
MKERTLVLIKPDGVERKLVGKILSMYEEMNLDVVQLKMIQANFDLIKLHYNDHIDKPFFEDLEKYFLEGPICCMILQGENAIEEVRRTNGKTDPKEAAMGTIRYMYGESKTRNLVHSSDCKNSAEREIGIWF